MPSYSASSEFGNSTATIQFNIEINGVSAEYEASTKINNGSVSSIIGLEKQNSGGAPPQNNPEYSTNYSYQPVEIPVEVVEVLVIGTILALWAIASPDPFGEAATAVYWSSQLQYLTQQFSY